MSDEQQQTEQEATPAATQPPRRRGRVRRLLPGWRTTLLTAVLLAALGIGGVALAYSRVQIPAANAAATAQSNVYLYADGSVLARTGDVNRENVPLDTVPENVREAVLAAEDRGFYKQPAIDVKGMARAAFKTATGKGTQSGSTITQQYVKNYYLDQAQTVSRKIKEILISVKLGSEVSKDDILEGYLNTSYYGRGAYGIQAAAQAYYGKDVDRLTTAEGAYLATLLNAPSLYDTSAHPENKKRALARWNYVLDGMVKEGWLDASAREKLTFPEPKEQSTAPAGLSGQRGYLVEAVNQELISEGVVSEQELAAGGYRITTTIEPKAQKALTRQVNEQLVDQLDGSDGSADARARAGAASIDVKTGKVVAMYGGSDYTRAYVNNATRRDYQVASTFKPFVFASAVENGSTTQDGTLIGPDTLYSGENGREVVDGGRGTGYSPENEDQASYGDIDVTTATDKSVNSVYAQMAQDVGPAKVKQTAIDLGLPANTPDLSATPSIALGTATASVLDMTEAYATLAAHGEHRDSTMVESVGKGGEKIALPAHETSRAISRTAADTTTEVLRSVVENGSGTAAQDAGRPAAGKTGTGEDNKSAWFAGYTPELSTVVAVFGQDPQTGAQKSLHGVLGESRINGGGYPAAIWGAYTAQVLDGEPWADFELRPMQEPVEVPPNMGVTDPTQEPSAEPETGTPQDPADPTAPAASPSAQPDQDQGQSTGGTEQDTGTGDDGTLLPGAGGDGGTESGWE
ncbi:transglycosylase domain-containing protein [Streptomyces sp. NPDC051940]|uniref:transglycosylase domain-containing protein n=1 Tax=Streptomyces sp. NPDC051940 TaxID=3155675 RepID=UPI003426AA84